MTKAQLAMNNNFMCIFVTTSKNLENFLEKVSKSLQLSRKEEYVFKSLVYYIILNDISYFSKDMIYRQIANVIPNSTDFNSKLFISKIEFSFYRISGFRQSYNISDFFRDVYYILATFYNIIHLFYLYGNHLKIILH